MEDGDNECIDTLGSSWNAEGNKRVIIAMIVINIHNHFE